MKTTRSVQNDKGHSGRSKFLIFVFFLFLFNDGLLKDLRSKLPELLAISKWIYFYETLCIHTYRNNLSQIFILPKTGSTPKKHILIADT